MLDGCAGCSMVRRKSRVSIELDVQAFQIQVHARKVGEVTLRSSKSLVSPQFESSAVLYGELGLSDDV
ncbi:hypothetical protein PIB30_068200 [Stylosanthes scabra]|uniref:Uncharacterized protein n=1 Tax=Stylosanthes scabra TaxID=79078 RepID=A0ABU6ZLG1_9FABA|nr:hypothetical protein [Stylosanthes scabra]